MKKNKLSDQKSLFNILYNCYFKLKNALHKKLKSLTKLQRKYFFEDFGSAGARIRSRLLLLMLFFMSAGTFIVKATAQSRQNLQMHIADEIIRFHVIANSDSDEDQALKLAVKNTLVKELAPYLKEASSKEAAKKIISDKLEYIKELAVNTIQQQGCSYPVKVSLEECYFPLKVYGEYAFPPGYYEALKVEIGNASGKNWWCVMFPPLCFIDDTYSIVDDSSGKKLKYLLSEEEYESLKINDAPVKIKFRLLELICDLFKKSPANGNM